MVSFYKTSVSQILYLICFLAYFVGVVTTTIDCLDPGQPGQSSKLICKIAGTIDGGIIWWRPNGGSPQHIVSCNTANDLCLPSGGITGYTVNIDSPAQQTLTIEAFNTATDAGEWACGDLRGLRSTCEKTVVGKFLLYCVTIIHHDRQRNDACFGMCKPQWNPISP